MDPLLPSESQQVPRSSTEPRPAKSGYRADPEDQKLITRVQERINFSTRESARWALERQIFEAISMYMGIQWIEYSDTTKRFTRWNAPSWFPTPVTNLIAPRVQIMQSSLLRSEPQGRVRPDTNEPSDREAAKVAEQLIGHFYTVTDEDALRQLAAAIVTLSGTVIAEDYWNPRAGKMLQMPQMQVQETPAMDPTAQCPTCQFRGIPDQVGMPCPMCPPDAEGNGTPMEQGEAPKMLPDGTPAMTAQQVPVLDEQGQPVVDSFREGEIESRVRQLFNFYWDPKATSLKEARWCGEAVYVDLDWLDENYPDMGPYVSAEEGIDAMNFYEASLLALVGPSIQGTAHYGGTQYYRHGTVLRKYQEKPSQANPNGLFMVVANGVLLYKGDLPITDQEGNVTGDFSYTEYRWDVVPGRFAGRTPVDDMVPLQKRVNGIDAQIILNRKTLLNPWVLAPKGSGLNPGQVAMRPGATILYNFIGVGMAPQVVQGVALPAQVMEERQQAIQAMDSLAQDAAAGAQAAMPQGVKSGIALNFMREQQQELAIPRLKRWGLWIAERDRKRLLLAQRYYTEPRAIKLMGQGSDWQVHYWQGTDLRGNTDVTVDPGTLMPKSQSLKAQTIFDALDQQLIDVSDPVNRQKLIEELGIGEAFDTAIGPDRRRAQKENAQMDEGMPVELTPWEDKQVHLAEHLSRMKDPSFDSLSQASQQLYMMHMQETQQSITQEAQQQEAQQLQQTAWAARAQSGEDVDTLALSTTESANGSQQPS